ncbi:membrane protein [Actinomadura nitritigenes]|uniref:Membrane-anchored protein n=1 Tax=Actinomadura nitritigenes TaxID=134602 RepID=A0ABS3RHY9_9ACTN|nr:hypothetical protein [Actinomadura nitritigenes]MBO2445238.1 hypothetical protein [Actinomadura nitritigenes]
MIDDMATSQVNTTIAPAARRAVSKVPEVTAYFWIVKILTTGMGETTSDYLAHRLDPIVAVLLTGTLLAAALALQFRARTYIAWKYWASVTMVSVFGTMAADVLHVVLGVPYLVSTAFFAAALALVFTVWYASERTLSIHGIVTARRELFYWATVMTTFALGTATGDMTAVTGHLGYLASGVAFALLIALPALAYRWLRMNAVLAFWAAYVLTRPLGASFADWMGVSHGRGGLALGTGPVSLVLAVVIAGFVGYLTATRKDTAR